MKECICPKCRKKFQVEGSQHPAWPFCSIRCKDADLHGWLSQQYVVSREITDEDLSNPDLEEDLKKFRENLGPLNPYDPNAF